MVLNVILWSALLAFSQNTPVNAQDDPHNAQAPGQTKCPSKPALGSTGGETQTLPATTKVNRENLALKTSGGSREREGDQGDIVHDKSLSTMIDYLTKDTPKPAQCVTKTGEGASE